MKTLKLPKQALAQISQFLGYGYLLSFLLVSSVSYAQCGPDSTAFTETRWINADAVIQSTGVQDPTFALGSADGDVNAARIGNNDTLVLDMGQTILSTDTAWFLGKDADVVTIEVSPDLAVWTTAGTTVNLDYLYVSTVDWRYVRITKAGGGGAARRLDAVRAKTDVTRCVSLFPNATNDNVTLFSAVEQNIHQMVNDTVYGGTPSYSITSAPINGAATINGNGTIAYTSNVGFLGLDSLEYEVCTGVGYCDNAWVVINVTNPCSGGKEIALDTVAGTPVYAQSVVSSSGVVTPALALGVPVNDNDVAIIDDEDELILDMGQTLYSGDLINVFGVDGGYVNAWVSLTPHGPWTLQELFYGVLDLSFNSSVDWRYIRFTKASGQTPLEIDAVEANTIQINALCINRPPVAVNDTVSTSFETAVVITPLNNDYDPYGDSLVTASIVTNGTFGTGVLNANSTITYTPNNGFTGWDTLQYAACDTAVPALCDTAFIYVRTINTAPLAVVDSVSTNEETTLIIDELLNDIDAENGVLTVTLLSATSTSGGAVSLNADTTITYTPILNFNGFDSFDYEICDDGNPVLCDTGRVVVDVIAVNDQPVSINDSFNLIEDASITVMDVKANDNDTADGGSFDNASLDTVAGNGPKNGQVFIDNAAGRLLYVPNSNFNGKDSIQYLICDNGTPLPSRCDTAWVIIDISPVNDAPVANEDTLYTAEDSTALSIVVVSNDDDVNDPAGNIDVLTLDTIPGTGPYNGSVTINNATGELSYTPNTNFNGRDSVQYVICDDGNPLPSACDSSWLKIIVDPRNDAPVAANDTAYVQTDTSNYNITVVSNDSDPLDPMGNIPNASLDTVAGNGPKNGSVTINGATGSFAYTPNAGFSGKDSILYIICDDGNPLPSRCDSAWVIIFVTDVNNPPVAINDTVATTEDIASVTINVVSNDNDNADATGGIDVSTLDTIGVGPFNGVVTNVNTTTGEITYVPNSDFNGTDSLQYVICDNGSPAPVLCDTGWVFIQVAPVNDAPVLINDTVYVVEDTGLIFINVLANDTDPDAPIGTIDTTTLDTLAGFGAKNGTMTINNSTGIISYQPNANFNGPEAIRYQVCDNGDPLPSKCSSAWLFVVVSSVNDSPVALNDSITVVMNSGPNTFDPLANDDDPYDDLGAIDNATLDTIAGFGPKHGTLTIDNVNGEMTYDPTTGYSGKDSIQYVICDNGIPAPVRCDTAWIYITVLPINVPPIANNDNTTILEDITSVKVNVLANDTDVNLDNSTLDTVSGNGPFNGTIIIDTTTGELTYSPNANFNGKDSVMYSICDDGIPSPVYCDSAWFIITVQPVNDAPFALNDTVTIPEDTTSAIAILDNDYDVDSPDGNIDTSSITILGGSGPFNGTAVVDYANGVINYTPNAGISGVDVFKYIICDDGFPGPSKCDTGRVVVNISSSNDPPIALNDNASMNEDDGPVTVTVVSNDSDPDFPLADIDNSTLSIVVPAIGGSTSIDTVTGSITYTPNANFNGKDSVAYVICDNGSPLPIACDTAWVFFDVAPINDEPIVINDTITFETPGPGSSIIIDPSANDGDFLDPLGNLVKISLLVVGGTGPNNGTVNLLASGDIRYTPDTGFVGLDSLQYRICDDGYPTPIKCAVAWVFINVVQGNRAPSFSNAVIYDTVSLNDTISPCLGVSDPDTTNLLTLSAGSKLPGLGSSSGFGDLDYCFSYVPNGDSLGLDTMTVVVCDDGSPSLCDTTLVIINVLPGTIRAVDDSVTCDTGSITFNIGENDSLFARGISTYRILDKPDNGDIELDSTGEVVYNPEVDSCSTDEFTYEVCNSLANCDTAKVSITIIPKDSDGDGIPDYIETTTADTDEDGVPDYLSTDSDGDGILDMDEGNTTGDYCNIVLDDCDEDGIPDYQDGETDCEELFFPEGFSPDGNGINDYFVIRNVKTLPENSIVIFNRWGEKIYEASPYNNEWDGYSQSGVRFGKRLAIGTYFYIFKYGDGSGRVKKGYIYLTRE